MKRPMVSVVVAAYNAMNYLRQNVESLLAQSMTDFELIYVDDGSKDDTLTVLKEYADRDQRIKVIAQDNHGAGHARNTGMKVARGNYVLVLDADDYFHKEMLQKTVEKAEELSLDICIFDHYMHNEQTGEITNGGKSIVFNLLPEKEVFCAKDIPDYIFQITGVNVWNKLYRREFLVENDIWFQEGIRVIDDFYLEIVSLAQAKRIGVLQERFVYYRYNNPASQISNVASISDNECKACEAVYRTLLAKDLMRGMQSSWTKLAYEACINSLYRTHKARFEEIYVAVKEKWIPALGIEEQPEEYFYDGYQFRTYNNIQNMNMVEFLLWLLEQTPVVKWKYSLPAEVLDKDTRLIIYGAGLVGKDYYAQATDLCKVVAWADQRYEELHELGYPVVSPETLHQIEYDCILFAFENEGLANRIMLSLAKNGLCKEKMLWIKPRVNLLENK